MSRTRLSTTVDEELLQAARRVRAGDTDPAMIEEALRALVARHRSAEVEASYTAYDEHPLDETGRVGGPGVVPRSRRTVMTTLPARGEVWWCEMAEIGRRPVVVLSRDAVIPRHRRA